MNKAWTFLVAVALATAVTAQSKDNVGSLYQQGATNPLLDNVARNVGDILLIEISETSVSTFAASTAANKGDASSVGVNVFNNFLSRIFGPLSANASSSVSGSGNTSYRSQMATRMSVVVKEVRPGGLMVVEGSRSLVTNKETQTFVLRGLVRQTDVRSDNTIDSAKIADAEIKLESEGMIGERQRKGILTRLLDWLF